MLSRQLKNLAKSGRGLSLVELMIVSAIVGILAAVAIPTFTRYVKEAGLAEATANVQGILEAEQAYFVRFQRYTAALPFCPPAAATAGTTQLFDPAACDDGWQMLGWSSDGAVAFQYRVFSAFDPDGDYSFVPTDNNSWSMVGAAPAGGLTTFGVDWATEFSAADPQPWCAVEAMADADGDGDPVFIRSNSYNHRNYRHPNPDTADPTY